jgi:hypothetical protein
MESLMESILCAILVVMLIDGQPIGHVKTAASSLWLLISLTYFVVEPSSMTTFPTTTRYALLAFIGVIFTYLIAVPITPLALFFVRADGFFPTWLCWLQTFDASVDQGWKGGYFTNTTPANWWERIWSYSGTGSPTGLNRYLLRIRWLWRNPAYGFDLYPLGIAYNPDNWIIEICNVVNGQLQTFKAVTKDGRYFSYIDSSNRKFGWKLWWALDSNFHLLPIDQFTHVAIAAGYDQSKRIMFVFTP